MRRLALIIALVAGVVFLLPGATLAQLFDGPGPVEDVGGNLADDDSLEAEFEYVFGDRGRTSRIDESEFDASDFHDSDYAQAGYDDELPAGEFVIDDDFDLGDPNQLGLSDDYFESTTGRPPVSRSGNRRSCGGCGDCGIGCRGSGWVCLEDIINWQNAKAHLHTWFAPLNRMPAMQKLHKLKERRPMQGTSWLNRPLHADWFLGVLFAGSPRGNAAFDTAIVGGYRVGRDVSHQWGYETRLAYSAPDVTAGGVSLGETADVFIWDVSGVYYPWGDSTTRPYLTAGLGFAHFDFRDGNNVGYKAHVLAMPIGMGVKWHYNNWTLARIELLDNISFSGSGVSTMHNVTLTGGVEFRFGGTRTGYWPWNPGSYYH